MVRVARWELGEYTGEYFHVSTMAKQDRAPIFLRRGQEEVRCSDDPAASILAPPFSTSTEEWYQRDPI
jgi:hypothetical protein